MGTVARSLSLIMCPQRLTFLNKVLGGESCRFVFSQRGHEDAGARRMNLATVLLGSGGARAIDPFRFSSTIPNSFAMLTMELSPIRTCRSCI